MEAAEDLVEQPSFFPATGAGVQAVPGVVPLAVRLQRLPAVEDALQVGPASLADQGQRRMERPA